MLREWKIKSNKINKKINHHASQYDYPYIIFGIFGVITYPVYYFIWKFFDLNGYENLYLRLIATILCAGLVLSEKWPTKLKKYIAVYWYITTLYCLPYLFTVLILYNGISDVWAMNTLTVVVLSVLLLDLLSLVVILPIGILLGILTYYTLGLDFVYDGTLGISVILTTYISVLFFGALFAQNKQRSHEKKLRIKAEISSKTKSAFIANMSHDIRTPITGILGMAQDMLNVAGDAKASLKQNESAEAVVISKKLIETVEKDSECLMGATDELLQLCNEVLEVMKLESGHYEDNNESFDINLLIQHIFLLLKPIAKSKKIDFSYNVDKNIPRHLKGNRIYIDRVLLNLISNALKFTENGRVAVSLQLASTYHDKPKVGEKITLKILVKDTGVGIPKDKFDTIFEHFSRLTPSYNGRHKGAGLGLYTVKRYIDAMKGNIEVSSEMGQGTCFTATLPLTVSDFTDNSQSSTVSLKNIVPKDEMALEVKGDESNQNPTCSILVVEDNALAAIAIKHTLKELNCRIKIAKNGYQAVSMIIDDSYDLIFMDIGLPDIDGIETTKKIREIDDKVKSQVPIVALTGHADNPQMEKKIFEAGAQAILSKPAQLLAIENILKKYVFDSTRAF